MKKKPGRNYYLGGIQRVRSANERLIKLGVSEDATGMQNGAILINFESGPVSIRKTITRDQIKQAYKKAVESYAEEL